MYTRGESGVGTLVIFIALLLVAAVAAGVVLQTAGSLQQKALSTGVQGVSSIATAARVLEVRGVDGNTALQNLTVMIAVAPGSEPVGFAGGMVSFNAANASVTYQYSGNESFSTNASAESGTFGVVYVQRGATAVDGVLARGDLAHVMIATPHALQPGEEIRLQFRPPQGQSVHAVFSVPDVIQSQQVFLYP